MVIEVEVSDDPELDRIADNDRESDDHETQPDRDLDRRTQIVLSHDRAPHLNTLNQLWW